MNSDQLEKLSFAMRTQYRNVFEKQKVEERKEGTWEREGEIHESPWQVRSKHIKYRGKKQAAVLEQRNTLLLLILFAAQTLQLQLLLNNNVGCVFVPSSKRMIKQQNNERYSTATDKSWWHVNEPHPPTHAHIGNPSWRNTMIVSIMNKEGKDFWAKMWKGAFLWFPNGMFWWLLMSIVLNFCIRKLEWKERLVTSVFQLSIEHSLDVKVTCQM